MILARSWKKLFKAQLQEEWRLPINLIVEIATNNGLELSSQGETVVRKTAQH